MNTDVAYVDPAMLMERAADPGAFVVDCLERGKSWLAEALEHGDLEALVNAKGYAETLRVATMQKQLGKDAQLSAMELVRRAERCIGLGIRQGQAEGSIRGRGHSDGGPREPYEMTDGRKVIVDRDRDTTPISSPRDFVPLHELTGNNGDGIYAMTDDVTDEEFEVAIAEARIEENLSRANLTRKLKPEKVKPKPADRSDFHRGTRRINPERIIEETINTLEGLSMGLALIEPADYQALDAEKRLEWLEALRQPLSAITTMRKALKP